MYLTNQNNEPVPPYEYQEYPKWVGDVIVQNADEEESLAKPTKPKKPAASTDQ